MTTANEIKESNEGEVGRGASSGKVFRNYIGGDANREPHVCQFECVCVCV